MERLCIVDMNFTWPPDGGAPVDLLPILERYSEIYDTTLLVPRITHAFRFLPRPWPLSRTKFFLRGQIRFERPMPFRIEYLDFGLRDFSPAGVASRVRKWVERNADHVIVAGGWCFKPAITSALKDLHPVLFLYAHEMLCINGDGILFRNGEVCPVNYLDSSSASRRACVACTASFYASYPSPRWVYEFLRSRAFTAAFQKSCVEAFNSARKIFVKNNFIAGRLKSFVHVPIEVVPPPIETERFRPADPVPEFKQSLLATGRLDMRTKGFHVLLEACRKLHWEGFPFRLKVVGAGKLPNEPFIDRLPWHPYERVHEIYREADVVVVPSVWPDPHPMVVQEAMACGLPVIGSAVGGIPEEIVKSMPGILETVRQKLVEMGRRDIIVIAVDREKMQEM